MRRLRGAGLLILYPGRRLASLACPGLWSCCAFSACFYLFGERCVLRGATELSPLHKKNSVALWLREKICCSRKIKRLKAARIIAQRQVRGNANGALGLRTNKIRPVRTKEKKSVYSVRSRKIENSVLKNANQCSIAPRSCWRANASFARRLFILSGFPKLRSPCSLRMGLRK